ncbi:uncharacterized protein G2W53_020966 [Senna tora]|uniref:Uncharacterized protein n=1 Tax=Senna tora TaxID=362788 RepID=A0A834TIG8_9FABA|nr:uncharacterized protein G2W53_020966 [Senna tora]
MGGGGAMRTVVKAAGIGVASTGLRGLPGASPAEHSVRQASRPVSAVLSASSQGAKAAEVAPLHTAASWDSDDWDLAFDEELVMKAGEPTPRVVFDGVPSFNEAKAATAELKDAIDELYLSSSQCEGSLTGSEVSVHSPLLPGTETKSCVIESNSSLTVPNQALQAFKFLNSSSEAQTIVASLASDPNVWNAIMENETLKEYFKSQQKAAGFESEKSTENVEELPSSDENINRGNVFDDFKDIFQSIKCSVKEMVSNVSNYFNNIFGVPADEKTSSGNTKASFIDPVTVGGSIMGLAVMVVMVVLLKRNY